MKVNFDLGGSGSLITSAQDALSNRAELQRMAREVERRNQAAEKDSSFSPMPLESYRLVAMGVESQEVIMARAAAVSHEVAALLMPQTTRLDI